MNGHRTAIDALLTSAHTEMAEFGPGGGPAKPAVQAKINVLEAARAAGDQAEEAADDEVSWDFAREGAEARLTLLALRRSIARTLGIKLTRSQFLGPDQVIDPPADEVLLETIQRLERSSKELRPGCGRFARCGQHRHAAAHRVADGAHRCRRRRRRPVSRS
jgi:hypothetical protein